MEECKIDKYDWLNYYDSLLNEYTIDLFTCGLGKEDYYQIRDILFYLVNMQTSAEYTLQKYIKSVKIAEMFHDDYKAEEYRIKVQMQEAFLQEIVDIKNKFLDISRMLEDSDVLDSLWDFLQKTCSITHLVYTNNVHPKVRPFSLSSFMFLCQFHVEKTPSLGVDNRRSIGCCFGCGTSFSTISYIQQYEDLTQEEAMSLLARVYLIDIDNNIIAEDDPLVLKYRESLLSDGFSELMKVGYERTKKRGSGYVIGHAILKYEQDFETINRVRNQEHIKYLESDKPKRIVLKMPA